MTRPTHIHFITAELFGKILLGLLLGASLFMVFAPEVFRWME